MKKDSRIYLDHILESFSKVVLYLEDVSYEAFLADEEKQDAIIRKIEVASLTKWSSSIPSPMATAEWAGCGKP